MRWLGESQCLRGSFRRSKTAHCSISQSRRLSPARGRTCGHKSGAPLRPVWVSGAPGATNETGRDARLRGASSGAPLAGREDEPPPHGSESGRRISRKHSLSPLVNAMATCLVFPPVRRTGAGMLGNDLGVGSIERPHAVDRGVTGERPKVRSEGRSEIRTKIGVPSSDVGETRCPGRILS